MELKKRPKSDVDKRASTFFLVGLIFSILLVIVAFKWKFYEEEVTMLVSNVQIDEEEEIVDVTKQEKPKVDKPPPPPEIIEVEDDQEIEENTDIFNVESQETDSIAAPPPPVEEEEEKAVIEKVFVIAEKMPSFPKGEAELIKFIRDNVVYPQMEKESGIQGVVYINFVVEKNGAISNVKVLKGVTSALNQEAVRVIKKMPRWSPGKQADKSVRVSVNIPIRFTLRD